MLLATRVRADLLRSLADIDPVESAERVEVHLYHCGGHLPFQRCVDWFDYC